ncbi:MAG: hypothetical protein ABII12_14090 [Planctomycetota bacterium]
MIATFGPQHSGVLAVVAESVAVPGPSGVMAFPRMVDMVSSQPRLPVDSGNDHPSKDAPEELGL